MSIGIVDVGIGNIGSLNGALYSQGWDTVSVASNEDFEGLSHLFLPGVGAFRSAMLRLDGAGLVEAIRAFAAQGRPVMGICLGMQLLADSGIEGGPTEGLGLIPGDVIPLEAGPQLRLPHVGWNEVVQDKAHPLLKGIRPNVDFYFVHSYCFHAQNEADVVGTTDYGVKYPSIVVRQNVVGAQFHPEKSQRNGLCLLDNFCLWDGTC